MPTIQEAQTTLRHLRSVLNERRRETSDPKEKAALEAEVERLNVAITELALKDLDAVSLEVAKAADAVEAILRTAKVNVFDRGLDASLNALAETALKLSDDVSKAFVFDAPRALDRPEDDGDVDVAAPAAAAPAAAASPGAAGAATPVEPAPAPVPAPAASGSAGSGGGLPPIVAGRKLAELSDDYIRCWGACVIRPERREDVARAAGRLLRGEARYRAVGNSTGVPWQLIGLMHGLECGYDFNKHLHNGDSLGGPTVKVPSGRPPGWVAGSPWEESARDALELKNFHKVQEWTLPRVLYALEAFNGFGYRGKGIRSPYLWSFSNLYEKGKYVRDHVYDPEAVSKQVGSAVLLKHLEQQGFWP